MVTDVVSCLSTGACIAIKKGQYHLFIGIFILAGIFLVMLILIKFFTPAFTFLKAKLTKNPIMYVVNRSQRGRFAVAKIQHEGIAEIKHYGPVLLTENSHTIEQSSNQTLFITHGEFAATIPRDYAYIVNDLREKGLDVNNWDDLDLLVTKWHAGITDDQIVEAEKEDKQKALDLIKLRDDLADLKTVIRPLKTIKIHDLQYMFPYNITPALVESKIQYEIAKKQQFWNKWLNMQTAIIIITILVGMVIAGVILWKFFGNQGTSEVEVKLTGDLLKLAANATSHTITA